MARAAAAVLAHEATRRPEPALAEGDFEGGSMACIIGRKQLSRFWGFWETALTLRGWQGAALVSCRGSQKQDPETQHIRGLHGPFFLRRDGRHL